MATIIDRRKETADADEAERPAMSFPTTANSPLWRAGLRVLQVLASLKITIVLFAMAIFIIFVGTLAQTEHEIWTVVHTYFRSKWVWIPFQVFFPKAFFPKLGPISGEFPFLGGWGIGCLMAINLVAAHLVRFKVQASGRRLAAGLAIIGAGCLVTAGVILSASRSGFQVTLLDPSMRILWQLVQGTVAGLILLAGCSLVFGKRGGVVLLHSGIGLMMFSELLVGLHAVEAQMLVVEGDTANFVQDIRATELAVIDSSDPKDDKVVVIPQSVLKDGEVIKLPAGIELPFDIRIVKYIQNAELGPPEPDQKNLATAGAGRDFVARKIEAGVGTDVDGKVDQSAAYVEILKRGTHESLGTYLLSIVQSHWADSRERTGLSGPELRSRYPVGPFGLKLSEPAVVEIDGKPYRLALRHKRIYKDYAITLRDVQTRKYLGTDMAKDYTSIVRVQMSSDDPARSVDRDQVPIRMNNPLRFNGETFYQSSVTVDPVTGEEGTGLQVVSNTGWMIPYVSCMIVAVGMLYQFSLALVRFLGRLKSAAIAERSFGEFALIVGLSVCFALVVGYCALPPRTPPGAMDLYAAGKIPVHDGGRIKPLDALARTRMLAMSNRETFKDAAGKTQPALRWLLDAMAGTDVAEKARVLRIDSAHVVDRLGLESRDNHLYSMDEIEAHQGNLAEFIKDLEEARKKKSELLDADERKTIEVARRLNALRATVQSLRRPVFSEERLREVARPLVENFDSIEAKVTADHPPLLVPVEVAEGRFEWKPVFTTFLKEDVEVGLLKVRKPAPTVAGWDAILTAYRAGDAADFNQAVRKYQALLAKEDIPDLGSSAPGFEAYFNQFSPLFLACWLYVFAFVLTAIGWLGWTGPINRAAFWFCLLTLALHTFGLVARIYISGRPPVTNLYSTAPFIGWGCLVLALVFEAIFRLGIGNAVASIAGFATLFIAWWLSADGDTFAVLSAVLDTQFWLATHVVAINLGYASTLLSGLLGLVYIARGMATPTLNAHVEKDLARMIYGTLCFGIFFSFVGTVLGGLWADDSWGRFWGWDPKENGALIIVLWNALVLHARWDGLVKGRGMAVLAVGGNIVTAWSWFGVNELNKGMHTYGISEGRKEYLAWFCLSQLVVIALAALPRDCWWSYRARQQA